ncbi:MAG: SBBP repeat-containing protein [Bacteroidota bacterium]
MKTKTLFLLLGMLFSLSAFSQTFEWAKQTGGTGSDVGKKITTDASGNIYTIGYFQGTVDFDPNAGTSYLTSTGGKDIFVQKLDASGNFIWAKQIGGKGDDNGGSIKIDTFGNIYLAGAFSDTADFDPGTGLSNLISAGGYDIFILKLNATGNFVWATRFGGEHSENITAISLDDFGNVYATGNFFHTVDFDPGVGVFNLSAGFLDICNAFVLKLDRHAHFVWAKQIEDSSPSVSSGMIVSTFGDLYITGNFYGVADFNPGYATVNITSNGAYDVFILNLDSSGNYKWVKKFGSDDYDYGGEISTDVFFNIFITGTFSDTLDFDPGTGISNLIPYGFNDMFILKLDAAGNFIWAKQIGNAGYNYSGPIFTDVSGNLYATGSFTDTLDFDPGAGVENLISAGNNDIYLLKLDTAGDFLWVKQIGDTLDEVAYSGMVDATGNIYTTGSFQGTVDFDPGAGIYNLVSAGSNDAFILKLNQPVGISEHSSLNEVNIFPNPSTGDFTIDLGNAYQNIDVTISDISGRIIFSKNFDNCSKLPVHLNVTQGFYVVSVKADSDSFVRKIIKN